MAERSNRTKLGDERESLDRRILNSCLCEFAVEPIEVVRHVVHPLLIGVVVPFQARDHPSRNEISCFRIFEFLQEVER